MAPDPDRLCFMAFALVMVGAVAWGIVWAVRQSRLARMTKAALEETDPEMSIAMLEEVLAKALRWRRHTDATSILYHIAFAHAELGDHDQAIAALDRASVESERAHDFGVRLNTQNAYTLIYGRAQRLDDAVSSAESVVAMLPWWRADRMARARALANLGDAYYHAGAWQDALDAYEQPLKVLRGRALRAERATVLAVCAICHAKLGAFDLALGLLDEAYALYLKAKMVAAAANVHGVRASVYDEHGETYEAISWARRAVEMSAGQEDAHNTASLHTLLADYLAKSGKTREALEFYRAALETFEEVSDENGAATVQHEIDKLA